MTMASYTMPLKTIIEQPTQHIEGLSMDERIEVGRKVLFDFDYPMFDDRYKKVFETNFINNFYDREIGFETEFLFKRRLRNWLNINMGYYSKLFESELIKFDPLLNSEMNVNHTKKNDEKSLADKTAGETSKRDITDKTITDEDTSNTIDKDVDGNYSKDVTDESTIGETTSRTVDQDVTGSSTLNTTDDVTGETADTVDSNITGTTSGKSDGTSNTDENIHTETDETETRNEDRFNRNIHTDTPDTRLGVTADPNTGIISGDGTGSVGYASDITEDKGKSSVDKTENEVTDTDRTVSTTTSDTTSSESSQNELTDRDGTYSENRIGSETGSTNEATDVTESGTSDTNISRTIGETGKSSEATDVTETGTRDETVDRTIGETGNKDLNENITGEVNNIEDFVQHRVGKIGVQTYSKMLIEFRSTFLRIERDIFDEMNQLFMLVY